MEDVKSVCSGVALDLRLTSLLDTGKDSSHYMSCNW